MVLVTTKLSAQSDLNFNKLHAESEDKWVVFQKNEDKTYMFGFIYIDGEDGLTFKHEGRFEISSTGKFIPTKHNNTIIKVRLEPSDDLVAFIPKNKFKELKIDSSPND